MSWNPSVRDSAGAVIGTGAIASPEDIARALRESAKDNPVQPTSYTENELCEYLAMRFSKRIRPADLPVFIRAGLGDTNQRRITTNPLTRRDTSVPVWEGHLVRRFADGLEAVIKLLGLK